MRRFMEGAFRFVGAVLALVRAAMVLGMMALAGMSLYMINMTARMMVDQYNETLIWKDTAYGGSLAQIEPAFVSNRVDTGTKAAAEAFEAVDGCLASLEHGQEVDADMFRQLAEAAAPYQEQYGVTSDAADRLLLYADIEDALPEAYASMETGRLQALMEELSAMEMEGRTAAGQAYMDRIRQAAADLSEIESVMEQAAGIGTLQDGIWTLPGTCTYEDVAPVLERVGALHDIPVMQDTCRALEDIEDVLAANARYKEWSGYQAFKEAVGRTGRSDYVPVSSIYTYGQALEFGCIVSVLEYEGYEISLDSKVTGIWHDGERLEAGQYIRNGAPIEVEIDPEYVPLPGYGAAEDDGWYD